MSVPTPEQFSNIPVAGVYSDTNYDLWFKTDASSAYRLSDAQPATGIPPATSFLYYSNASISL